MSRPARRRGKEQRQLQILDDLRTHPVVRVSEIAQRLGVHVETIRRDLDELHGKGKISRTYGGALPLPTGHEASLAERDLLLVKERRRVADLAAGMIEPGDVIMIDVGSTTAHFVRSLAARGCPARIITNSCKLATAIGPASQLGVVLCPGEYSDPQGGVAGPDTVDYLENFRADKLVFSAGGLDEGGIYEVDPNFAAVKRVMIHKTRTRILLLDHSKLGRAVMTRICGFEVIDHLVIDQPVVWPLLDQLEQAHVQIHVA